jgi:hypothetical protein
MRRGGCRSVTRRSARHLMDMKRIVASDSCSQRQEVSVDRARALTRAARLLARALEGRGEFVNWAVVPSADRDELEAAFGELRAALAGADLTVAEVMEPARSPR